MLHVQQFVTRRHRREDNRVMLLKLLFNLFTSNAFKQMQTAQKYSYDWVRQRIKTYLGVFSPRLSRLKIIVLNRTRSTARNHDAMIESAGCASFRCMGTCRPTSIGFRVKRYSVLKSEIHLSSGVRLKYDGFRLSLCKFQVKINVFLI